ncbi:MAG: class B sortase [Clostridium sp.]|nr:class B sortase [Clostridium sp.]
MAQKVYIIDGRQFRTESDYRLAMKDKKAIDTLRRKVDFSDRKQVEQLCGALKKGSFRFHTVLGQDFLEEVQEALQAARPPAAKEPRLASSSPARSAGKRAAGKALPVSSVGSSPARPAGKASPADAGSPEPDSALVRQELKKRERRRRLFLSLCGVTAAACLGYFAVYSYFEYRTLRSYENLSGLREKPQPPAASRESGPIIHYTDEKEAPEVLAEYKNLLNKNKKLIGWLKIDDTNIDYPVMQTTDNEYYLDHNLNQEYDKNGSIFLDKDCDVIKPSDNFIVYGHNMKSGQMFGRLDLYSSESYYRKHPYIRFDTIYEKGVYEILYVFRSHIYSEEDVAFKYYQFIDALSETEFDSYMKEMAEMSFYDTGVSVRFGDQLLTLSTCDYYVDGGRFVVVAKKLQEE